MNEPLTKLDIVKSSRVTEIIWRQDLNSTEDDDKLKLLLDSYMTAIPHHYEGGTTFKELVEEVKFLYFTKEGVLL